MKKKIETRTRTTYLIKIFKKKITLHKSIQVCSRKHVLKTYIFFSLFFSLLPFFFLRIQNHVHKLIPGTIE